MPKPEPDFPSVIAYDAEANRGRRERIATVLLQGCLASGRYQHVSDAISVALGATDLLMSKIDDRPL